MEPDLQLALRDFFLTFPIFVFALSFHEAAHAITAKWGGDLTSAYQGRITLNPLSHIHPVGTVIVPLISALQSFPLIGWARPVPVVETNYRRGRGYGVIVALAGPFSNLLLALATVVLIQVYLLVVTLLRSHGVELHTGALLVVSKLLGYSLIINLMLMFFNLLPIPPLDGSHVLWHAFVKDRPALHGYYFTIQQFSYFILIALFLTPLGRMYLEATVYPATAALLDVAHLPLRLL